MNGILPAYLTDGETVSHSFFASLLAVGWDHRSDLMPPVRRKTGPAEIATARNEITAHWLDNTDASWLWFVDTDMGFAPDTPYRLRASAYSVTAQVIGALSFSWRTEEADGMGGWRCHAVPTLYDWDGEGFKAAAALPVESVVRVGATGAACLLIHRTAATTIRNTYGDDWWSQVRYPDGRFLGEDLSFCYRLAQCDIPVYVDMTTKTTHAKMTWVGEGDFA